MKVLITRYRENSLGYHIVTCINGYTEVHTLNGDIRNLEDYPDDLSQYARIINVAGITLNQPVLESEGEDINEILTVNMLGAMQLTAEYAKDCQKNNKTGAIFHIGSIGSRKVMTNCSAYSASKAGLAHYIHCAGYELKSIGMKIIGIDPPNLLGTPMTQKVQDGLINNRGMSLEQVNKIYADAADPFIVGKVISRLVLSTDEELELINGENIVLGKGDHR